MPARARGRGPVPRRTTRVYQGASAGRELSQAPPEQRRAAVRLLAPAPASDGPRSSPMCPRRALTRRRNTRKRRCRAPLARAGAELVCNPLTGKQLTEPGGLASLLIRNVDGSLAVLVRDHWSADAQCTVVRVLVQRCDLGDDLCRLETTAFEILSRSSGKGKRSGEQHSSSRCLLRFG